MGVPSSSYDSQLRVIQASESVVFPPSSSTRPIILDGQNYSRCRLRALDTSLALYNNRCLSYASPSFLVPGLHPVAPGHDS
ncbi:hypothetical protein DL766_005932 [Monosporascus sp. MC13-8B]|uniref:Uncharacterized protein n=1 Tax=Monosporascus cannonballus TaxID=155416 RepID=A0ABY0HBC2_9PEZI|nr:hypothetical protein DL762_003601 [Monosporascus cannonballus]RYP28341.1 hypothetical protein DL766_005932 [Monosporascus sp. MC13-8B]